MVAWVHNALHYFKLLKTKFALLLGPKILKENNTGVLHCLACLSACWPAQRPARSGSRQSNPRIFISLQMSSLLTMGSMYRQVWKKRVWNNFKAGAWATFSFWKNKDDFNVNSFKYKWHFPLAKYKIIRFLPIRTTGILLARIRIQILPELNNFHNSLYKNENKANLKSIQKN